MIKDIEGRDINVGDECYIPWDSVLVHIKITKETPKAFYYNWKQRDEVDWRKWETYSRKSAKAAKNLIKIC